MNGHNRSWWVTALLVVLVAGMVGVAAYNLGLTHGLAQKGLPAPGAVVYPYGWYHPWGFGFGFLFPFLFFAFWIFIFRGLFWRGAWRRGGHCQAHEMMKTERPDTGAGGR
jgi:hypothetical protein